jgi:hypothetical protein
LTVQDWNYLRFNSLRNDENKIDDLIAALLSCHVKLDYKGTSLTVTTAKDMANQNAATPSIHFSDTVVD